MWSRPRKPRCVRQRWRSSSCSLSEKIPLVMASPKVSVIIPVYNTAGYLARCLKSVCGQTLRDIEIICIDDGSTDDSLMILRKWRNSDCRIKLIEMGENRGAAAARNAGITIAKGDFLGFVDSDDFIDLDYYENLIQEAERSSADIVRAACVYVDPVKIEYNDRYKIIELDNRHVKYESERNRLFKKNKLFFCDGFTTCIIKKDIVIEHNITFPEGTNNFEDVVFLVKSVYFANYIATIENTYYFYYLRENSNSRNSNIERKLQNVINNSQMIIKFMNICEYNDEEYMYISKYILETIKSLQKKMRVHSLLIDKIISLSKMNRLLYKNKDILFSFARLSLLKKR